MFKSINKEGWDYYSQKHLKRKSPTVIDANSLTKQDLIDFIQSVPDDYIAEKMELLKKQKNELEIKFIFTLPKEQ
ncbi:hypothetical protein ED407_03015 [Listeria monocytogenes]|nr:hypothetical protein [Listeria monocytogenes]EAD5322752.1 hypothetical protein [Listeria monocytogenes]EAE9197204.1 hypothetical protein [Listeria monocytogenes]EAE9206274.1 hypothetical protein [Listeria monocytogenes]MCX67249.1 hypothetical protein [Listeria monocytogenes]